MDGRISNPAQLASLRSFTVRGGQEDGLRVIEGDNGVLRFLLNESKALDIMQMYHRGVNLSFLSKNGLPRANSPFRAVLKAACCTPAGWTAWVTARASSCTDLCTARRLISSEAFATSRELP